MISNNNNFNSGNSIYIYIYMDKIKFLIDTTIKMELIYKNLLKIYEKISLSFLFCFYFIINRLKQINHVHLMKIRLHFFYSNNNK